jgi:Peptidase family M28/PDZ domain
MRTQRWLWVSALLLTATTLFARAPLPARSAARRTAEAETRLRRDLQFLAADECEGRGPTTQGITRAATYIAAEFKKAGLAPGGTDGTWFQPFTIPANRLLEPASISLRGPLGQSITLRQGTHFNPMGLSSSGAFKDVGVVFAGYGISVSSKEVQYDDYQDVDVGGKVVIVLRDTPNADNRYVTFDGRNRRLHGSLTRKMEKAEKNGALAIFFVNDADTAKDGDDLMDFAYLSAIVGGPPPKIPAFHVRRAVLEQMLASSGAPTLTSIEEGIDRDRKPRSVSLTGWKATFAVKTKRDTITLKNIVGVLPGKGPRANETVVIGAHYDHLGYGSFGSMARLKKMVIHNGADDNGSGTVSIIELARRFARQPDRQGRRLVFIAFSGEEMGLLGSRHYCRHPLFPLDKTVAMLNLDMVGRLRKDEKTGGDKLVVYGTDTAKTFASLLDQFGKGRGFQLLRPASSTITFGQSDHASFYREKVPVYFFFTGNHPDYHSPTDDADKINIAGVCKVCDLVEALAAHIATAPDRPEYVKVKSRGGVGQRPRVSLGIRPEYGDDRPGVLISGIADGRPAARAGIKEGDRIVEMGSKPIKNLEGYMVFLNGHKSGDTIEVGVMRDKKKLKLKVKLD